MKYQIVIEMDGKASIDALVKAMIPIKVLPHVTNAYLVGVQSSTWHNADEEAFTNGEKDEVALIVWRTTGGKAVIEWIPYCPMRDGTWDEFIRCFRILFWCYEKDLFQQAIREAKPCAKTLQK